jgi:hypothetical protein
MKRRAIHFNHEPRSEEKVDTADTRNRHLPLGAKPPQKSHPTHRLNARLALPVDCFADCPMTACAKVANDDWVLADARLECRQVPVAGGAPAIVIERVGHIAPQSTLCRLHAPPVHNDGILR